MEEGGTERWECSLATCIVCCAQLGVLFAIFQVNNLISAQLLSPFGTQSQKITYTRCVADSKGSNSQKKRQKRERKKEQKSNHIRQTEVP